MFHPLLRAVLLIISPSLLACATSGSPDEGIPRAPGGAGGTGGEGGSGGQGNVGGSGAGANGPGPGGGASCTLGTVEHCGACDAACPGKDDEGTVRLCTTADQDGECDVICQGEFYDVDGDLANGCEVAEAEVHDSLAKAISITLPDTDDPSFKSNPLNLLGRVYGDARQHAEAPAARPNGREDWWRITAVGQGKSNAKMGACLGVTNFPPDALFEICISDLGVQSFSPAGCATVMGMQPSVCVTPPSKTDEGTPYYVRVRKISGSNTKYGYALFMQH